MLRGRLTLRTPAGERELTEGDVVAFPRGADGAHGTLNRSEEPARYVIVAAHDRLDVIEYLDRETFHALRDPPRLGDRLLVSPRGDGIVHLRGQELVSKRAEQPT